MTIYHEETHRGLTIKIEYDECSADQDPRDWDHGTTFVLGHNRYDLPNDVGLNFDDFGGWDEVEAHLREEYDVVEILAVRGYDHGSLHLSTSARGCFSDPWDSGMAGFIFMTKEDQKKCGTPDDRVVSLLESALEEYDQWANGEVYGYVIETPDGEHLDSCWGFVGDYDGYVLDEARGVAEGWADDIAEKRRQAATDSTIATMTAAGLA